MKKRLMATALFLSLCISTVTGVKPVKAGDDYEQYESYGSDIADANITLSNSSYTYDGLSKEPNVTVELSGRELEEDEDYYVSYSNNINAGEASVTITAYDYNDYDYTGSKTVYFTIKPKRLKGVRADKMIYSGKKKNPRIYTSTWMYLKRNKDYTIKKKTNFKSIGKHKATIKLKGNYTGTISKEFTIVPKSPKTITVKKRTSSKLKIKWSKVKGSGYYKVEWFDNKKSKLRSKKIKGRTFTITNKSNDSTFSVYVYAVKVVKKKKYTSFSSYHYGFTKPKRPKFKVRKGFGEVSLEMDHYGSYQFQWSTSKKFKRLYSPYGGSSRYYTSNWRLYNLSSGEIRYIRVREYIQSDGKIYMGPWSKKKKVKVY